MISSRCDDPVNFRNKKSRLSDLRMELKNIIQSYKVGNDPLFDAWINEDEPPEEGSSTAWDGCMQQVRDADVVLVLYNGNAGWCRDDSEVGICHGEFAMALNTAPAKVRVIELPPASEKPVDSKSRRFREFYVQQGLSRMKADSGESLIAQIPALLHDTVVDLVRLAGREARKGKFYSGPSLDWSRLDFKNREAQMLRVTEEALLARKGSRQRSGALEVIVGDISIVAKLHAMPGPFSVAVSRAAVGQPFLYDHELASLLVDKVAGPIHLIMCHRSATEAQATSILGMPDVTLVTPPFGVFAADNVQYIQVIFVSNCRDETSTRTGLQRVFEWLEQSGEGRVTAQRAIRRARIVKAISKEQNDT